MNRETRHIYPVRSAPGCQPGFTLIELMISITIGLLMMVAMLSLYVNTSRTNNEMAKTNSLIESGRFAIQLLENDIVHAGFWGTYVPPFDDFTSILPPPNLDLPDPCLPYSKSDGTDNWDTAHKNNLIGINVQAYDAASVCSGVITNKLANTDVLVVRHAEACVPGADNCAAEVNGDLYFQNSLCENEINPAPPTSPTVYVLESDATKLILHNRNCTTIAEKRKFISNLYYIRNYAVTAGDGISTLVRSQFDLRSGTLAHQGAEALIEGIEGFRVEFGIDNVSKTGNDVNYITINWQDSSNKTTPTNRGDGIPDAFCTTSATTACNVLQSTNPLKDQILANLTTAEQASALENVTAVKLYVLTRSRETTQGYTDTKTYTLGSTTLGPFNDHYKRNVFSTTVRLHNISGRRETP